MENNLVIGQVYQEAVKNLNPTWFEEPKDMVWYEYIVSLPEPFQITYMIVVLDQQVFNGGFDQYFSNLYGQFAYETVSHLKKINAYQTALLLEKALLIINDSNYDPETFRERLLSREIQQPFNNQKSLAALNDLDNMYYDSSENVEELLSIYLKAVL